MKILIVAMLHDYGIPERGYSFEYYNFYQALKPHYDVSFFDFMGSLNQHGKKGMNEELLAEIRRSKPDVALFFPYTDQFIPETIRAAGDLTATVCYFYDTQWRVSYSQFWARHFRWATTPDIWGVRRFAAAGIENIIYSPFGCSPEIYKKEALPQIYDVSFVGLFHPRREWLIKKLRKAGFKVNVRGAGWPEGQVSQEEMVRIFYQSRINLNLSNSASWDLRYLASSPRALLNTLRSPKNKEQLKGRHFEINSCGAFQLSYYVEGLESCYEIGKEIEIFETPEDLIEKTRYYLDHETEREQIARAGHERTLRDHALEKRIAEIIEVVSKR